MLNDCQASPVKKPSQIITQVPDTSVGDADNGERATHVTADHKKPIVIEQQCRSDVRPVDGFTNVSRCVSDDTQTRRGDNGMQ